MRRAVDTTPQIAVKNPHAVKMAICTWLTARTEKPVAPELPATAYTERPYTGRVESEPGFMPLTPLDLLCPVRDAIAKTPKRLRNLHGNDFWSSSSHSARRHSCDIAAA